MKNYLIQMLHFTLLLVMACSQVHAASLNIEVLGVSNTEGQIVISVYTSEGQFLKTPLVSKTVPARSPSTSLHLTDLPNGSLAVGVFHDQNSNKKLDTNFIGIPKEPNGVSNNALGKYGPPKFNDAKFDLNDANMSISITLHN